MLRTDLQTNDPDHAGVHNEERRAINDLRSGASYTGGVTLESFDGATDDERLGNAMAYAAAQTHKPSILLLENRDYGPFRTPRTLYSGFGLHGGPRFASQHRAAQSTPQRVLVNTPGAWLRMPGGQTFDVEISRLSFYSQSATTDFLGGHASGVLWTSVIRDVGFSLFRHVLGSPATKLLITAVLFDGWWNINNSRSVAMTLGGADNVLWAGGLCLLDSPPHIAGNTPYHLHCSWLSKTVIGPMFITAEQAPAAVLVQGSPNAAGLIFQGTRMEGRNQNQPSYGAVVRVEGGHTTFRDCWIAYGLANPGASPRSNEQAVVQVLGGRVLFDGCYYARAGGSGVSDQTPFVHASGASTRVRIRNVEVGHNGGSFSDVPRVRAGGGAVIDADSSVVVV
jgi:hypothetical protein